MRCTSSLHSGPHSATISTVSCGRVGKIVGTDESLTATGLEAVHKRQVHRIPMVGLPLCPVAAATFPTSVRSLPSLPARCASLGERDEGLVHIRVFDLQLPQRVPVV